MTALDAIKALPVRCDRQFFGYALEEKEFEQITQENSKYKTPKQNRSLSIKLFRKFVVSSPVNKTSEKQLPIKKRIAPVWASSWKVIYPDNSSKTFNVTLFNSKNIGQEISLFERQPLKEEEEEEEKETTYVQIDDTEVNKERSFIIISGVNKERSSVIISDLKKIYKIGSLNFVNLNCDLKVGKGICMISLHWSTTIRNYLWYKFFPVKPLELSNGSDYPETFIFQSAENQLEEKNLFPSKEEETEKLPLEESSANDSETRTPENSADNPQLTSNQTTVTKSEEFPTSKASLIKPASLQDKSSLSKSLNPCIYTVTTVVSIASIAFLGFLLGTIMKK